MLKSFFLLVLVLLSPFCEGSRFQVYDFGLWEMGNSRPVAINDRKEIVGTIQVGDKQKIFYWNGEEGKSRILEEIPDGATITKMNNQGQVIGHYYAWHGWWTPTWLMHAFVWSEKEGFKSLGVIDDKNTTAVSINDRGEMILATNGGDCFLWEEGAITQIPGAAHVVSNPSDHLYCAHINEQEVVYVRKDPHERKNPAFLCRFDLKGRESTVLVQKDEVPFVTCVSKEGKCAGYYLHQGKPEFFLTDKTGKLTTTIKNFRPAAISNVGRVVGTICLPGCQQKGGIFFENGKLYDVNDLLLPKEDQPFAFEEIISLHGINNQGFIIAVANCWNIKQAVLLIPHP